MFSIFDELVKYPRCGFHVETSHLIHYKQGLAHPFLIKCRSVSCRWSRSFFSSIANGSKPFDVNLRIILAFREIGKGHAGIETFFVCMNMPTPMTELTYFQVTRKDMANAVRDLLKLIFDNFAEEQALISIDTGKCLSYECLVKNCESCEMWESRKDTSEYDDFMKEHECPIN